MENKKAQGNMSQDRRNDYDVTNTVQVSNPVAVRNAVHELFSSTFPGMPFDKLWLASTISSACSQVVTPVTAVVTRPITTCNIRST